MAWISGQTIITSLSLFHITLGFFFFTNPITIADQALVYILGNSMGLPYSRSFDAPSPPLAFLGVVLASVGINDLLTLSLPEEVSMIHYWGTQAPVRLFVSLSMVCYSFFFSASSPLYGGSGPHTRMTHPYVINSAGDALKNRVFFSFMFVEAASWFWIWVTLREERQEVLARKARRRSHQQTLSLH